MVITKQKPIIDTQMIKRKHTTIKNHQRTKTERKKGKKELQNNYKMEILSPYLSIITLKVNGLNFSIKRKSG